MEGEPALAVLGGNRSESTLIYDGNLFCKPELHSVIPNVRTMSKREVNAGYLSLGSLTRHVLSIFGQFIASDAGQALNSPK